MIIRIKRFNRVDPEDDVLALHEESVLACGAGASVKPGA